MEPRAAVNFTAIETGGAHTCALSRDGDAYCWGYNPGAWLGPTSEIDTPGAEIEDWLIPRRIPGATGLEDLQVGGDFACGLAGAAALCWGRNEVGQLGVGTRGSPGEPRFEALPVDGDGGYHRLGALSAAATACALDSTGLAHCWGNNWRRQVGAGWGTDSIVHTIPTQVAGDHVFAVVAAGPGEVCGLTPSHDVYCWGSDHSGLKGADRANDRAVPVQIPTPVAFDTIGVGSAVLCGLADGQAYCRGWNGNGVLGTGDTVSRSEFAAVEGGLRFRLLSVGRVHVCGLTGEGTAYCWGHGAYGRLGYGGEEIRTTPTRVAGDLSFDRISAGGSHTCGLTASDELYCWGEGFYGQLGNGDRENHPVPVPVAPPLD